MTNKKNFASLYTGFDGVGVGAKAAGLELAWGLEILPKVAQVANSNLGGHVRVGDILDADPRNFDRVDVLHASPVCKRFSQANKQIGEAPEDIAHARKIAEFVTVLRPEIFTLENVWLYRFSKSLRIIESALWGAGYWLNIDLVNAVDYGVPQTRKRLILRAVRGGTLPYLPQISEWKSWHLAVADLLDDMPECEIAPWQLRLMPAELATILIGNQRVSDGSKERSALGFASADQPSMALTTRNCVNLKAYLVDGANSTMRGNLTMRSESQPAFTLTTSIDAKQPLKCWLGESRTVQLSMRGAARLQSFPDWYELPPSRELAGMGIGNSVPPLMYQRILEGMVQL